MRLVRGTVVICKTSSISKTCRILRRFIEGDAGADPSVINYVKRAAEDAELSLAIEKSGVNYRHRNGHLDLEEVTTLKTKKKKSIEDRLRREPRRSLRVFRVPRSSACMVRRFRSKKMWKMKKEVISAKLRLLIRKSLKRV
eukprot:TRINITY_DN5047_c0_g1_i2.p1 TRINITY_DN5047_c0_g1~~TRINITY_DN5047_c0_g1_i2.p1  ORF type:complete len:141 (+),score=2.64 TRINITY_DN5047_c0_g1_i2:210-632(+)